VSSTKNVWMDLNGLYDVFLWKELHFGGRADCTCVKV